MTDNVWNVCCCVWVRALWIAVCTFLRQEIVLGWPKVRMALKYHEVMINLDQNPVIMEHMGVHMPVILASISNMHLGQSPFCRSLPPRFALKADRPLVPKDRFAERDVRFRHSSRSSCKFRSSYGQSQSATLRQGAPMRASYPCV